MVTITKEQAAKILEDNPRMDRYSRKYFEAHREGNLSEYLRGEFTHFKEDLSDEIPQVDVRTLPESDPDISYEFKCQRNPVNATRHCFELALDGVLKEPETIQAARQLLETDLNFQVGDPANEQRIKLMNNALELAIKELSND